MKHNEKKMRDAEVPNIETEKELSEYIKGLVEGDHDYGTCVYAMSMSAVAAFNYAAHKLGVTGFQASCADLDILRRTRRMKSGFCIVDYENLLYPQYCDDDHIPGWRHYLTKNLPELKKQAKKLIKEKRGGASPNVVNHWKWILSL